MKSSFCFRLGIETHILSSRRQSHSSCSRTETSRTPECLGSHFSGLSRRSPLAMNARALALLSLAGTHTQLHQNFSNQSIPIYFIFNYLYPLGIFICKPSLSHI